jgi:hypothetical protein
MLRKDRHLYFWSMLVCGIALIAILPDASWIYSSIAAYDSSRWAHFLEYAIVTAIPVGAWGRRSRVMISFIPIFLCIALEALHIHFSAPGLRSSNISADLFGVAAGILLGMNIRVIRSSEAGRSSDHSDSSRPTAGN